MIEYLARQKFGEPNRHLSTRRELRFGSKGSISVQLDGMKAGAWFDHEAQEGGYLQTGDENRHRRPPPRPRGRIEIDDDRVVTMQSILARSCSATGTPTEAYLKSRGITEWPGHSIRHCSAPHGALWLARDGAGAVKAVQVVYLMRDGTKDRRQPVAKRTLAIGKGWHETAAVALPGRGEPVLCEGVETGLSIWLATTRPVFCGMGIGIFGSWYIRAKRITFAEDGNLEFDCGERDPAVLRKMTADKAMQAALAARKRQGKIVKRARPPLGMDFNDIHQRHGLAAVAAIIKGAKP